ncbi:MAG TPA: alpha/beta fold hydrolase [Gemmatimonadales bacterium]
MNPLYFGTSARPLLGVYHPARTGGTQGQGIVLCYPFGQEYMRAHRAFRQLALLLSKRGFHVFRFDYSATGDSAGESGDATTDQWVEDIETAVDELRDTAAIDAVSLIGLRLGAALAATAASRLDELDRLVLWDPVVRGTSYITEIQDARTAHAGNGRPRPASTRDDGTVGILGFPLTPVLRASLEALDLTRIEPVRAKRSLVVVSGERDEYHELYDARRGRDPAIEYQHVPTPGNWNEVDNFGSALLPQQIIQAIVAWMV